MKVLDKVKLFRLSIAYGLCSDVSAYSPESTVLLDILEPFINNCDMPDCHEPSVRVGIYAVLHDRCEFRGLCERHKQFGMLTNDGGWES